jgi:hypothetical protein
VEKYCDNATLVAEDFKDSCKFDVCATGDILTVQAWMQATYDECLEDASNGNGDLLNCIKPCPNLCSFAGECCYLFLINLTAPSLQVEMVSVYAKKVHLEQIVHKIQFGDAMRHPGTMVPLE